MREIKFKVWDKEEKRMSKPFDFATFGSMIWYLMPTNDGGTYSDFIPAEFAAHKKERFEWLQFTGLKDAQGVEIYEGDLLTPQMWCANMLVRWNEDFGYDAFYSQGYDVPLWKYAFNKNIKVVGNIYENPDMLSITTREFLEALKTNDSQF